MIIKQKLHSSEIKEVHHSRDVFKIITNDNLEITFLDFGHDIEILLGALYYNENTRKLWGEIENE